MEIITGKRRKMSVFEFELWNQYREKFGFKTDRLEWATANGTSAVCHAFGAKVTADDISPKFGRKRGDSIVKIATMLAGLPGAKITFTPKDASKPVLHGKDAMLELDAYSRESRQRRRTLDDKNTKPSGDGKPKRRLTLDGR